VGGSELLEDERRELDDTDDFDEDDDLPEADEPELLDDITMEDAPATEETARLECGETPGIDEVLEVVGDEEPFVEDDFEEIDGVGIGILSFMLVLDALRFCGPQMLL
jgi:hypothetical protein